MRRKAWIAIRNGEVMPYFYVRDTLSASAFTHPEEVIIAGPVNIDAPPRPTDVVPMGGRIIWTTDHGYIELLA